MSFGPSPEEPGCFRLSRGDLSGLIVRSVYARSALTPHARQSKARLRGPFWMNSLTGPQRMGTCLLSAATHSRFCRRLRVMITHTSPNDQGRESWVYPKHKRPRFTLCPVSQFRRSLVFLGV